MAAEIPSSCRPDKYLTESHLKELFNDFTSSIESSRPLGSTFASLVNSVRLVYKDPLFEALQELQAQVKELAVPRAEQAGNVGGILREPLAVGSPPAAAPAIEVQAENQDCTATTFPLYIYSAMSNCRRDWATWDAEMESEDGFEKRMSFRAFKFQEPGLIEIEVYHKHRPDRTMAVLAKQNTSWWTDQSWWGSKSFSFWAYGSPGPGRERIWVGWDPSPERGVFVRGGREGMENWEEKCEFWVPI